jgi:hypothetical protein
MCAGRAWEASFFSRQRPSPRRGCTRAHTSTYAFQALAFYQRHGYQVIGQLDDYPDGYTFYWLRKDFVVLPDAT